MRARSFELLSVACAVIGAGCGKSEPAPPPIARAAPVVLDVAGVNALVPAALKAQLVFEARTLTIERGARKTTYALAAPAGWAQDSKRFAHVRPDERAGLRLTRFAVGANCDGECVPKDWAAIADRVDFAPRAQGVVRKDERRAGHRMMIADITTGPAPTTVVVTAWWSDGASSYHVCTATLDAALAAAAPAFEHACQAVAITGDD